MTAVPVLLAARLKEARTALGLTQEDVAGTVGLHRSAVSEIESGNRKVYGGELRLLSRLYRRPVSWLLGDEEDPDVGDEIRALTETLPDGDRDAVLAFARFLAHQKVAR